MDTISWVDWIPIILIFSVLGLFFLLLVILATIGTLDAIIKTFTSRTAAQFIANSVFTIAGSILTITGWATIAALIASLFVPGF